MTMKIFGLAGWSGSGKTTLIVKLIPELVGRGFTVSTMKHAHHEFDIDRPGKDSHEHRQAGANEVMISASKRWALMHEVRDEDEPSVDELIARMSPVDILLVEGFKWHAHPKMEIHRPVVGKPLLQLDDPEIIAVASDEELPGVSVPVLELNNISAITEFIIKQNDLKAS
jgi:molybdopterin-guanine dinucleotide biosynthesis adapter protein